MRDSLGAVVLAAVVIAGFLLFRRYMAPVSCPRCGSGSWIIMDDRKECRDCGHLFY